MGGAVGALVLYLAVAALLRFAWNALKWWREIFIVTDKFFMVTSGVFGRKISMMPTAKVTHLAYLRTTGGRVLGYGTIRVKSAGQKQETGMIGYLPKPEAVFDAIRELIVGVES